MDKKYIGVNNLDSDGLDFSQVLVDWIAIDKPNSKLGFRLKVKFLIYQ